MAYKKSYNLFRLIVIFITVFTILWFFFTGGFGRIIADAKKITGPKTFTEIAADLEETYYGISPYWLDRYGITVKSESDIEKDHDEDGLTLMQEYVYLTNPFDKDTDRDGYTDGAEVSKGYSPSSNGRLDMNKNNLPDDWEEAYQLSGDDLAYADPDGDGLLNHDEFLYNTNPNNKDTDGDGYTDYEEVANGYDPVKAGEARPEVSVAIPKLTVEAPVIISQSSVEADLQKDLEHGVILYPKMAMPGQRGNLYIAGHSSNFVWSKGAYNTVFKDLDKLVSGDVITTTTTQSNGKSIKHNYTVTLVEEVAADDPRIFDDAQSPTLTLTTCWPLGSNTRRIMVKAEILSTENGAERLLARQ